MRQNKIGVKKSEFVVDAPKSGVGLSSLCLVRNYQPGVKDLDSQRSNAIPGRPNHADDERASVRSTRGAVVDFLHCLPGPVH